MEIEGNEIIIANSKGFTRKSQAWLPQSTLGLKMIHIIIIITTIIILSLSLVN